MQASCEKRPTSVSGAGSPTSLPTSNCQPWLPSLVSSPVIHVPHGVTPPAQLRTVPASVGHADSHRSRSVSNRRLVVPPAPSFRYVSGLRFKYGPSSVKPPSWLRTRISLPEAPSASTTAMPSCRLGHGVPSCSRSPVQL